MKATFEATGDVVIITGGAHGIGACAARGIAAAGGSAVVFDVAPQDELDGVIGISQHQVDVADADAVIAAVAEVVAEHGYVSGLIAGAAVQPRTAVRQMDPAEWRRTLAVNLDGVMYCCQAVLPSMVAQREGSIVLFTSGLATMGRAEASAYAASKGAVIPFARSLAAEVADHRVRVNVLAPGVIDTPQFRAANPSGGEREHWEHTAGIGQPEDVVGPLLYLLSDAATMTGSTLTRDRSYPKE